MEDRHCNFPQGLQLFLLAGMVTLLLGAAPLAQAPEPAQDDSIEALRTRANAGDAEAQHNLGLLYFNGEDVPQDVAEAIPWFRKAAQQGFADAQAALGLIYRNGVGVPKDEVEAYKWFSLAATPANGEVREEAVAVRDLLDEFLTPEQVAEGQRRAREWFEAHPPE